MENLNINLSNQEVRDIVKGTIEKSIETYLRNNRIPIEESIKKYFDKGLFEGKTTQFDNALNWAVEHSFREGINKAMEELNFVEIIAEKAKELLSNSNFIEELALAKVRASLGLDKEN